MTDDKKNDYPKADVFEDYYFQRMVEARDRMRLAICEFEFAKIMWLQVREKLENKSKE